MKRFIGVLAFLYFIPWSGPSAQKVQNEGLVRTLGPEWMSLYEIKRDLSYDAIELVRNGDTVNDWREIVTLQDFVESIKLSPEEVLNKVKGAGEKNCPGVSQWNVIAKDENSILYESHSGQCRAFPEQAEIGRIILGKHSWYVLHYEAKVHELTPDARAQWIKTLLDATFDSVTSSFDSAWMSVDVDESIPFAKDKVIAAMKAAMGGQDCNVSSESADRIECKRPRVAPTWTKPGSGGESVTAVLEAQGNMTHVVVTTGLGFYGRLVKKNYSTPMYEEMLKNLQKAQP